MHEQLSIIHIACLPFPFFWSSRPFARTCTISLFDPVHPPSILLPEYIHSLKPVTMVNLPSPKDAASKSGEVLSGSSKEYKKESTAARVLGAGAHIVSWNKHEHTIDSKQVPPVLPSSPSSTLSTPSPNVS